MQVDLKFTDIVIPVNDFLLEADIVSGGLYICKNGGTGLLAKSANKDNKYVIQKFFGYLEPVRPIVSYENPCYYDGMKLPDIMLDFLLYRDTTENIIIKIKEKINATAKWMDKNGILALVDMTFDPAICLYYRKINPKIKDLILTLCKYFTVHIVDNCDKHLSDKLPEMISVNGTTYTSSKFKILKCSQGDNYDMYSRFMAYTKLNPSKTLFIETIPGYITAINNYAKFRGINISSIQYDGNKYDEFISNISNMVDINLTDKVGQFAVNRPKTIPVQGILLSEISIDSRIMDMRRGSAIVDTFIYNGKLYEKLIQENGDIMCTVTYSDKGNNGNERTVILPIKLNKYDQICAQFKEKTN